MKKQDISLRRRFVVLAINVFLFGIGITILQDQNLSFLASSLTAFAIIAAPILFALYPESPGMRTCNLKVVDSEGKAISRKKRFIRSAPGIAFALALTAPLTGIKVIEVIGILSTYACLFYVPINALHHASTKERISVLDRFLNTRIIKEYELHENLKPKFFGMKIK